jgi:protein O-mannosyl-transferase
LVLQRATGATGPSFMVAALFALHPLNVESVAWIAERKNLLSMMFFLLALGAYGWYATRGGVIRYGSVFVLFALGLMAKPQIITLPLVLLLWDYWPLERVAFCSSRFAVRQNGVAEISGEKRRARSEERAFHWLLLEKLPLFALVVASAVVTLKAQRAGGAVAPVALVALHQRFANAIVSYCRYIGNAFWPMRLAPFYPYPAWSLYGQVLPALLLLLAISALAIKFRLHRYLLVGWLWFLGTLVPMIGLVQTGAQSIADRYMYLPCIGLFLMLCWGVAGIAKPAKLPRVALPAISAIVLLALAIQTRRQLDYWSDNVTLWSRAVEVTTGNYIAEDNLGAALLDRGELEPAMQHFEAAAALAPTDPTSLFKIAMYEQRQQRWPEALDHYHRLLAVTQNSGMRAAALTNLGYVYRDLGDIENAGDSWRQAVDLDAKSARAWIGLGLVAQSSGELASAVSDYSHGVELQPSDVGYILLAQALEKSGHASEAQTARDHAQRISNNLPAAQRLANDLLAH